MSSLEINQYLKIGFILGLLQFIIYYAKLDYIVTFGPFVTHHFVELPAFYYLGRGFYQYFRLPGWSTKRTITASILLYVANILLVTRAKSTSALVAAFVVSFTYLIGLLQQWRITSNNSKTI